MSIGRRTVVCFVKPPMGRAIAAVAAASAASVFIVGCAAPAKFDRAAFEAGRSGDPGTDAATRRQGPVRPTDPKAGPPAAQPPVTGAQPPGQQVNPNQNYDATAGGKCADPAKVAATTFCGPYSPERRVLCRGVGGGAACLDSNPRDGWEKAYNDRLGANLALHTLPGAAAAAGYAAGPCDDTRVMEGQPVRLLVEPREGATLVADLSGSADKVNVEQTWGYWSQVKVGAMGERTGWLVNKGLRCNNP